jgi:hypothetical protein
MADLVKGLFKKSCNKYLPVQPAIVAGCDSFKRLAVNDPHDFYPSRGNKMCPTGFANPHDSYFPKMMKERYISAN